MPDNSPEVRRIAVPEGASVVIINSGQPPTEVPQETSSNEQWSSMKYWGEPTPEQQAHEEAFAKQLKAKEQQQDDFNRMGEKKRTLIRLGLIGAGVLTVVGIVSELH